MILHTKTRQKEKSLKKKIEISRHAPPRVRLRPVRVAHVQVLIALAHEDAEMRAVSGAQQVLVLLGDVRVEAVEQARAEPHVLVAVAAHTGVGGVPAGAGCNGEVQMSSCLERDARGIE